METRKEDKKMKKLKRKILIAIAVLGLILLFAGRLSDELTRMNNNLHKQNTIQENIKNQRFYGIINMQDI